MRDYTFAAAVEGGRLPETVRAGIGRALQFLDGQPVEVIIRPQRDTRSARSNRYYWFCLDVIGEELGYHKDELHDFFRQEFLEPKTIRLTDDEGAAIERKIRRSTTTLTTKEFTDYLARIKDFALNRLNIVLPEPEDLNHAA